MIQIRHMNIMTIIWAIFVLLNIFSSAARGEYGETLAWSNSMIAILVIMIIESPKIGNGK